MRSGAPSAVKKDKAGHVRALPVDQPWLMCYSELHVRKQFDEGRALSHARPGSVKLYDLQPLHRRTAI